MHKRCAPSCSVETPAPSAPTTATTSASTAPPSKPPPSHRGTAWSTTPSAAPTSCWATSQASTRAPTPCRTPGETPSSALCAACSSGKTCRARTSTSAAAPPTTPRTCTPTSCAPRSRAPCSACARTWWGSWVWTRCRARSCWCWRWTRARRATWLPPSSSRGWRSGSGCGCHRRSGLRCWRTWTPTPTGALTSQSSSRVCAAR
mmetsp:Transcript_26360/g.84844  ORF Transcript_26360/g.84844 Transcript_26360/m.84844 type:complete len:204 (-) Transcript_26360:77-688(-)